MTLTPKQVFFKAKAHQKEGRHDLAFDCLNQCLDQNYKIETVVKELYNTGLKLETYVTALDALEAYKEDIKDQEWWYKAYLNLLRRLDLTDRLLATYDTMLKQHFDKAYLLKTAQELTLYLFNKGEQATFMRLCQDFEPLVDYKDFLLYLHYRWLTLLLKEAQRHYTILRKENMLGADQAAFCQRLGDLSDHPHFTDLVSSDMAPHFEAIKNTFTKDHLVDLHRLLDRLLIVPNLEWSCRGLLILGQALGSDSAYMTQYQDYVHQLIQHGKTPWVEPFAHQMPWLYSGNQGATDLVVSPTSLFGDLVKGVDPHRLISQANMGNQALGRILSYYQETDHLQPVKRLSALVLLYKKHGPLQGLIEAICVASPDVLPSLLEDCKAHEDLLYALDTLYLAYLDEVGVDTYRHFIDQCSQAKFSLNLWHTTYVKILSATPDHDFDGFSDLVTLFSHLNLGSASQVMCRHLHLHVQKHSPLSPMMQQFANLVEGRVRPLAQFIVDTMTSHHGLVTQDPMHLLGFISACRYWDLHDLTEKMQTLHHSLPQASRACLAFVLAEESPKTIIKAINSLIYHHKDMDQIKDVLDTTYHYVLTEGLPQAGLGFYLCANQLVSPNQDVYYYRLQCLLLTQNHHQATSLCEEAFNLNLLTDNKVVVTQYVGLKAPGDLAIHALWSEPLKDHAQALSDLWQGLKAGLDGGHFAMVRELTLQMDIDLLAHYMQSVDYVYLFTHQDVLRLLEVCFEQDFVRLSLQALDHNLTQALEAHYEAKGLGHHFVYIGQHRSEADKVLSHFSPGRHQAFEETFVQFEAHLVEAVRDDLRLRFNLLLHMGACYYSLPKLHAALVTSLCDLDLGSQYWHYSIKHINHGPLHALMLHKYIQEGLYQQAVKLVKDHPNQGTNGCFKPCSQPEFDHLLLSIMVPHESHLQTCRRHFEGCDTWIEDFITYIWGFVPHLCLTEPVRSALIGVMTKENFKVWQTKELNYLFQ